jgi:hypothetical protein
MVPGCAIKVPVVGERVRVVGKEGEYMVICVHPERHVADLIRMTGIRRVEEDVSLRAIRPLTDQRANRLHPNPDLAGTETGPKPPSG